MDRQDAAEGESTATVATTKPCRFCQALVEQPKRRGQVKDFCSDRHRAAFRDSQIQAGIREAKAALQETRDELERLQARLDAADQLLDRGLRQGTRPRKLAEPKTVQPSAELTKALDAILGTSEKK